MKVFLSSTAVDLVAYRQVADDTILRLSQQAVAMERFGPLPGAPVDECERLARESDVVICIVAHRYGFEPEKGRGSITRREVEAAKAAGKDVLVWIVADDHPWTQKKESDLLNDPTVLGDLARVADVVAGVKGLQEFKAWLRETFVCDTFTTPDELGRKIALALRTRSSEQPPAVAPRKPGEIRIVHALQPAPNFRGREALLKELTDWVADPASPDRVWSLVAAGGTGKTAIVEGVVREMRLTEANVLVWSFYERPEADAFLRECNQLFLGEEEGPAGGRLERLLRGLRDGRPHLIVLDGLERVQEDAGSGRVRGELSDQTLKLFLRGLAAGIGRARALVTSRFPLIDLQDWKSHGYRETRLDDLTPEAAVAVLRGWGVIGEDADLRAAARQVGYHGLSIAVIGSYLHSFGNNRIEVLRQFELDAVTGEDPKAAKLGRVLGFYAERLPPEERDLMVRLSVFPRGVSVELLDDLIEAGGNVGGLLVNVRPRLGQLLTSLKTRGLVFAYQAEGGVTWSAHPFLRQKFRGLLGSPVEDVFRVVAQSLHRGLENQPGVDRADRSALDRYERFIEATRLAGREKEAVDLVNSRLGGYDILGAVLGEYERGYRILASFSATGRVEDLAPTLDWSFRSAFATAFGHFAFALGRLEQARVAHMYALKLRQDADNPMYIEWVNASEIGLALGRLSESRRLADAAVAAAPESSESVGLRGMTSHSLGDIQAARADFERATQLERSPLISYRGAYYIRHHIDLGHYVDARALCEHGMSLPEVKERSAEMTMYHALLARIELSEGNDPTSELNNVQSLTSRTGEMAYIIEAQLLSACHFLFSKGPQAALGEAEAGLLHAVSCGFGLLRIELLVTLARIRLAWPDPPKAIQAAREALDLSTAAGCQYAWGEADAAQVWGEAYFANHEAALAHRAFTQALAVRKRIEHPGVAETEKWLDRSSV